MPSKKKECIHPYVKFIFFIAFDIALILLAWQALVFLHYGFISLVDFYGWRYQYYQGLNWFIGNYILSFLFFFHNFAYVIFILVCIKAFTLIARRFCYDCNKEMSYNSYHYSSWNSMFDWLEKFHFNSKVFHLVFLVNLVSYAWWFPHQFLFIFGI
jgi:hypothetical protein